MSGNFNQSADVFLDLEAKASAPEATAIGKPASVQSRVLRGISGALLVLGIALLGKFSFYLAGNRIYQVDECVNVFIARMIAAGQSAPGMELFQLLLSRVMSLTSRSADLFAYARLVSLMIFWLNWILLALATGEKILSRRWLVALAGAATLAPMWDYGFEIRHDNLLLAGILLIWGTVRFQPPRIGTFFFVGACFVGLEFVSIKAVLYTLPISVGILVFPRPGAELARWKSIAAWCAGAVAAFFVLRLIFKFAGLSHDYLATVKGVASVPGEASRFWPFDTLLRLLVQTPLLVAVSIAAVIACIGTLARQRRAALNWDGILPEVLLLGVALAALLVNPNPYPYNLMHVVPYAFLLAYRYGAMLWKQLPQRVVLAPLALSVIAFTHLAPFGVATRRHLAMTNYRQEQLMNLTENLTDPAKDCVFDGIGLVPTRNEFDMRGFIHGQSLKGLVNGTGPHIRDMLAANPPSVVILSYRTEWLPEEDHEFIRQRYVPMADDFMVLGSQLPAGGGTFEVYHAGRYRVTSAEGSNIIGTYHEPTNVKEALTPVKEPPPLTGALDGVPLKGQSVELSVGTHRLECAAEQHAAVVWVGPHVDEITRMPGNNRHLLFVNWY